MQRIYKQRFGQHVFVTAKQSNGLIVPAAMTVRTAQSRSATAYGQGRGTATRVSLGMLGQKLAEYLAVNN